MGSPAGKISFSIQFCCSIQSGNVFSLRRPPTEHQIITYKMDYVIIPIGFLFGESPKPERVRVLTRATRSQRQGPDWISVTERFCLDQ